MISLIFTNIHHTSATNTTLEIIQQPKLIMGTDDKEKMAKSYGGANIPNYEQRIEFIVDFKNLKTYNMYINSLIESNDISSAARTHVDLLSHDIKVIDGKYYFENQSFFTGFRYMYGENSTNKLFLDFVDLKEYQVIVSLISNDIIKTAFSLYKYITDSKNQNKAWQLRLVLKNNYDIRRLPLLCILITRVFIVDQSMFPYKLVFLEEYIES